VVAHEQIKGWNAPCLLNALGPVVTSLFVAGTFLILETSIGASPVVLKTSEGTIAIQSEEHVSVASKMLLRFFNSAEKKFHGVTGFTAGDFPPVIVSIHANDYRRQGYPLLRVDALEGGGARVQLDLSNVRGDENSPLSMRDSRLLIEALLLREYYAGKTPRVGQVIPVFPEWLSHALSCLCMEDHSRKTILASYLHGGPPPRIDDFLHERPPDDDSHVLLENYNGKSACLLRAGLNVGGESGFREWIGHDDGIANGSPVSPFPRRWDKRAIERDWLLLMASSSRHENSTTEELSSLETLRKYDGIMHRFTSDIADSSKSVKQRGWDFISKEFLSRLVALRLQSNPLVSPLIENTISLIQSAAKLSSKNFAERMEKLNQLRSELLARSKNIDAYLDWYEASKVPVRSGLFDSMLQSPETSPRKGPVGRYLDAVQQRGW